MLLMDIVGTRTYIFVLEPFDCLCLSCHDNEHARYLDNAHGDAAGGRSAAETKHQPFADLASLLNKPTQKDD